jgi:hypothetical protein
MSSVSVISLQVAESGAMLSDAALRRQNRPKTTTAVELRVAFSR